MAQRIGAITLPTLFPVDGADLDNIPKPYQSVGARGVNHLASRLQLTLLPPNQPFFRFLIDELKLKETFKDAPADEVSRVKSETDKVMSKLEQAVSKEVEKLNIRSAAYNAFRPLLIGGSALIAIREGEKARTFPLSSYVQDRDPSGNIVQLVIKEEIHKDLLSDELSNLLVEREDADKEERNTVTIYTALIRVAESEWEEWQEIEGVIVPESLVTYKKRDAIPYIPLSLAVIEGADYGYGYCSDFEGDLTNLEGLNKAIVEASAAMALLLLLVRPNSTIRKRDIERAESGDLVTGDPDDISILQMEKSHDLSVAANQVAAIESRLNFAFLLHKAVSRDAERVTAEEIRFMATELENSLGGIFSSLANDFQTPLVKLLVHRMTEDGRMPELPEDVVEPQVVTGLDALGRGQDLNKLDSFVRGINETLGPEAVQRYVNIDEYLRRRASATGVDSNGLIKTEEQLAAEAQQAQQAELLANVAPNAVNAVGGMAAKQLEQPTE